MIVLIASVPDLAKPVTVSIASLLDSATTMYESPSVFWKDGTRALNPKP